MNIIPNIRHLKLNINWAVLGPKIQNQIDFEKNRQKTRC
jgi:hypothetical protein